MSRSVLWYGLLACFASPLAAQDASLVLARGRAGVVAIGMTRDSVLRVVDPSRVVDLTNCTEVACRPALGILRGTDVEQPALLAHLRERPCGRWQIASLEVYDPAYRTPDGIGVGTTRETLERRYKTTADPMHPSERYAPALGVWFRLALPGRSADVQVVAVIIRESSRSRLALPRCDGRPPRDRLGWFSQVRPVQQSPSPP
jgi:hypothetical protein